MSKPLYSAAVGFLVVATVPVSAQQPGRGPAAPRSASARTAPSRLDTPRILPGTRPDVFSAIRGNALSPTNAPLPNTFVRLRDARIGQIVDTQMTDQSGLFTFRTVDPGSYIVEIMGQDQHSVLAASQLLNVGAGEAVSAIVKLAFKTPPWAGVLGNSAPSALAATTQAAAAGVMATTVSGAATCETLQP
jgi:hypothetical protein